jgi:predicted nucleotidyltransferase
LNLWEKNTPATREALSKTFCRLNRLNIVDSKQLAELNIIIPKLAGPFSENLQNMKEEMGEIREAIASVESNPELSKLIYPVALIFGSRLKGYGSSNTDIDAAVFVKPGTAFSERGRLKQLLKETFGHEKINGELVEFWLEQKEDQLQVHDFTEGDVFLGESYWTHVLFGAAWEGNKDAMRELREKLLVPYLHNTDRIIHGLDARRLYLEEIERDTLQYRLMHKGYEKFFPPYGGIHTPNADRIDGHSMFWDSGYRQLATKLFASRVFLPKISK